MDKTRMVPVIGGVGGGGGGDAVWRRDKNLVKASIHIKCYHGVRRGQHGRMCIGVTRGFDKKYLIQAYEEKSR